MILEKTNAQGIARALSTLERMEKYKTKLKEHLDDLANSESSEPSGRLALHFFTHFTSAENASAIIKSGQINVGSKGFVSLTALHPIEFRSVAKKGRDLGFCFFADDIYANGGNLYTPVAYLNKTSPIQDLESTSKDLATKLIMEPSSSQESIKFVNMMEIRSTAAIPLTKCALFFRHDDISSEDSDALRRLGILQLPYSVAWFREHFVDNQSWFYRETSTEIEFFDNRVCRHDTADLINMLKKTQTLARQPTS